MKKKSLTLIAKKGAKLVKKQSKPVDPEKIPFKKIVFLSVFMNALPMTVILYFLKAIPPQVPLFYGLPEGEEQLTGASYLVVAPMTSLLILGVNTALSLVVKNDLLKKALIATGFIVSLFSFITILEILFLVGPF